MPVIPEENKRFARGKGFQDRAKEVFGNPSLTNQYLVEFSNLGNLSKLRDHIETKFGVKGDFIARNSGLLCSSASLPGTSLATAEVKDNFMGVSQEFAHTRIYTDIDFTFYVDHDYNNLRFFEGWIDFISSGSGQNDLQGNYYRRMRYPDDYKCLTMSITKFERDHTSKISYSFFNAFPKLITSIPVSYGAADLLQVSVSFNYDRYVVNAAGGFTRGNKSVNFEDPRYEVSAEAQERAFQQNQSLQPTPEVPVFPPLTPPPSIPNTGTGRDGNFGQGTYGQGLPSNPNLRSVTSEAQIRDRRTYGNTVPEGSFSITPKPKVPIRNRRGRITGYRTVE